MQNSLQRLSATSEDQIAYLKKLGVYPLVDELALGFEDSYGVFIGAIREGKVRAAPTTISMIDELNLLLDNLSSEGKSELWNADSLNKIEWNEIRKLASEILTTLDINGNYTFQK